MLSRVPPRVTVLIPALDEAAHIEGCVRSVLAQELDGGLEVIVVDGRSQDDTAELARAAGATVVDNAARGIPAGLNRGLEAARGDVIVRFDAHAEMPAGYVAACVRAIDEEPDAGSVGGWREPRGRGPWGRALAAALASPLGVGHALIWRRPPAGSVRREVEHVPLGCFRAETLRAVGGWREELATNEDFDLDHRLRKAGGRVVFDPRIWSVYYTRESLGAIARQYWRYGRWKAAMLASAPESLQPRQLAPPALVTAVVLAGTSSPLGRAARRALVSYALVLGAAAARSEAGWRLAPVLATMHLSWGAGLLRGLAAPGRR
jgi:glycosyltransferase involved in cell wall biosynthesis